MKIKLPEPFTFEAGPRAVLLLHGFSGHSADVRMLGRYLEKKGYTSHAPILRGHGLPAEELMKANPDEWWEDVLKAYNYLKDMGYEEIAVAGLSLGGALSIKLGNCERVKAVIPMCAPIYADNEAALTREFSLFAKRFKQFEQKDPATIDAEVEALMVGFPHKFQEITQLIQEVKENVEMIYTPTLVVQARYDKVINPESANYIYENVETDEKKIVWFENAAHVITLSDEKDQLHEEIYTFLEGLEWES